MAQQSPLYLQKKTTTAQQDRQLIDALAHGEGVFGSSDYKVTTGASGLNLTVAAGEAFVRGDTLSWQGLYKVLNDAGYTVTCDNADATNPRIDRVVVKVTDSTAVGGGTDNSTIEIVKGTAQNGATLDTLTGAAAIPNSCLHLADILIPNQFAGPFVNATHIRSRRPFIQKCVPPLLTDLDMVVLEPVFRHCGWTSYQHALHDTMQSSVLVYLPRRIVGATKIRFKYEQGATANTGNFNICLNDASGRKIVETGATAFAGAAASIQSVAATISATTFDAGYYYLTFGWDSATVSGTSNFYGALLALVSNTSGMICGPNIALRAASGGTTLPTTILGLTDVSTLVAATAIPPVPVCALSVT